MDGRRGVTIEERGNMKWTECIKKKYRSKTDLARKKGRQNRETSCESVTNLNFAPGARCPTVAGNHYNNRFNLN